MHSRGWIPKQKQQKHVRALNIKQHADLWRGKQPKRLFGMQKQQKCYWICSFLGCFVAHLESHLVSPCVIFATTCSWANLHCLNSVDTMFRWVNNNNDSKNKSSRNKNEGLFESISLVWSCFVYFDSLKSTGWQQRATWLLFRPEWSRRIFLQLSRSFEITKSSVLVRFQVSAQRDASCFLRPFSFKY